MKTGRGPFLVTKAEERHAHRSLERVTSRPWKPPERERMSKKRNMRNLEREQRNEDNRSRVGAIAAGGEEGDREGRPSTRKRRRLGSNNSLPDPPFASKLEAQHSHSDPSRPLTRQTREVNYATQTEPPPSNSHGTRVPNFRGSPNSFTAMPFKSSLTPPKSPSRLIHPLPTPTSASRPSPPHPTQSQARPISVPVLRVMLTSMSPLLSSCVELLHRWGMDNSETVAWLWGLEEDEVGIVLGGAGDGAGTKFSALQKRILMREIGKTRIG